jgi:hypothetical protein
MTLLDVDISFFSLFITIGRAVGQLEPRKILVLPFLSAVSESVNEARQRVDVCGEATSAVPVLSSCQCAIPKLFF